MKRIFVLILSFVFLFILVLPVYASINPIGGGAPTSLPTFPDVGRNNWSVYSYSSMLDGSFYVPSNNAAWPTKADGSTLSNVYVHWEWTPPKYASIEWPDTYISDGYPDGRSLEYNNFGYYSQNVVTTGSTTMTVANPQIMSFLFESDDTGYTLQYYIPLTYSQYGTAFIGQFVGGKWGNITKYGFRTEVNGTGNYEVTLSGTYYLLDQTNRLVASYYVEPTVRAYTGDVKANFLPETYIDNLITYTDFLFEGNIYITWNQATYPMFYIDYSSANRVKLDITSSSMGTVPSYYELNSNPVTTFLKRYYEVINNNSGGSGTLNVNIEENGSYTYDVSDYSQISIAVDVPTTPIINPDDPITPGQVLYIEDNGFYDVTQYNYVDVDVPTEIIEQQGIMQWLYDAVEGFLTMEIAPGFSIGGVLLFVVGFAIIIWIIKIFLGG